MSSPAPPSSAVQLRQRLRPWAQFGDLSALSIPISFSDAAFRIPQNLRFFFPNYLLILLITLFVSLFTHPLILILFLAISAGWILLYFNRDDEPLIVFGFEIGEKIVLGFLGVITLLALIYASVWKNVVVSAAIGALIVVVHGSLRAPEEDMDSPYGALLSDQGDYTMV